MRTDHLAYQQATRVSGFGLLLQLLIGLTLLLFGRIDGDTTFLFSAAYILLGSLVWIGLIIIFYQHKLERLEALEEDDLAASRGDATSVFDDAGEDIRVAAKRLRLMHKWLMPAVSLLLAVLLVFFGYEMIAFLRDVSSGSVSTREDATSSSFLVTGQRGWAVSICIAFALVAFIFSRFVAGMSKQSAWQNLRGGAAYMVGNAIVLLAVAVGVAFRFFDNEDVIVWVAYAVPIFMMVQAAEIVLNFILNLYRPRIPGEAPRPAFDSKMLSLFAAPDNLVRSLNEAVNYQFGFDITSSWGYQLLIRSAVKLLILGVVVMVALNTMVIVEPQQQAVKLARGAIVGEVRDPGVLWKYPWPFEGAVVVDVTPIRSLYLTARVREKRPPAGWDHSISLWDDDLQTDVDMDPFVVASPTVERNVNVVLASDGETADEQTEQLSRSWSLLDAEIILNYRVKSTQTGGDEDGLIKFLQFASDERGRERLTQREKLLQAIALRVTMQYLSTLDFDDLLTTIRDDLSTQLTAQIQQAFDERDTGVELVDVSIPHLRPHGGMAGNYIELAISNQARLQSIAEAERREVTTLTALSGSVENSGILLEAIEEYNDLRNSSDADPDEVSAMQSRIERMLYQFGSSATSVISEAERDRWVDLMNERTRANSLVSERIAFEASPELFMQRRYLQVLQAYLPDRRIRKYILGIDPAKFSIDAEFTELDPLLSFGDALPDEEAGQ